jgi:phthalate 4,5-dioxygenase oxygenase subunit
VPGAREANYIFTAAVPVDDQNMIGMTVIWSPDQPFSVPPVVDFDAQFRSRQNKHNDCLVDRELQRTSSFTGIRGVRVHDMAVQEDQRGPISDRRTEHLGASDTGVLATRRRILRQIKALQDGQVPTQPLQPERYFSRSLALTAPRSVAWQDLMDEHMMLSLGVSGGTV